MRNVQFRQGDVLLVRLDAAADKVASRIALASRTPGTDGPLVLAYGEKAGHAHQLSGVDVRLQDDGCYVVLRTTQLVHPEHAAITLEPGVYQLRRQQIYRPGDPETWSD